MEAFREAIVTYFDIGKQKVVWILKCREQHEEAAGNALSASKGYRPTAIILC
jgi:hypothetical protein